MSRANFRSMEIRVLFFGVLKDILGRSSETIELPEGSTLRDIVARYADAAPRLRGMTSSLALSVNQEYSGAERQLRSGDEVALLPPVSGGVETSGSARIVREAISTQSEIDKIKRAEDGATVTFEGVVRNNTRGRRTLYLEYESYEEMALKQMSELVLRARSQFAIRDASIVHRLGRLEIGETSVLIVVASAHRGPAFDACRWMIDTLKKTVPIWKKEFFEDGAVWADGEPFPAEISAGGGTVEGQPASK
jgi:MoaE-MoaD fusion protein